SLVLPIKDRATPFYIFFFQAEDGIRDFHVTGVQTCALPILRSDEGVHRLARDAGGDRAGDAETAAAAGGVGVMLVFLRTGSSREIGRASCRERVLMWGVGG